MGFFEGLARMRQVVGAKMASIADRVARGDSKVAADLEEFLVSADFGPDLSKRMMEETKRLLHAGERTNASVVKKRLGDVLLEVLGTAPSSGSGSTRPWVIFLVGPHGAGKTTTAGRLAYRYASDGKAVVLAAGDTHRAAAIDQIRQWADRLGASAGHDRSRIACIGRQEGADPAAVIFDAVTHARQADADVVIADTAGRIHTQQPLMESLQKSRRAMEKALPGAPHETFLVLDATLGQNALSVARHFAQAVPLTGLVLTKMDGTAKGGTIFSLTKELKIPVRFVGVGEGPDDLAPFEAESFVSSLLG